MSRARPREYRRVASSVVRVANGWTEACAWQGHGARELRRNRGVPGCPPTPAMRAAPPLRYKMKSHMEAVSLRLQTMQSSAQMAQCMKGVTKVMGQMNRKMNLPQISKIMMEFEKQNETMGMKEEMMADAMDDAFAEDEDEEDEKFILDSVLAELGIEVGNKMGDAPTAKMTQGAVAAEPQGVAAAGGPSGGGDDLDAELQKRLDNLRRT